ncbi:AAA family ATPase [Thermocatellispora tengchongensis]|uniref:AAA family ATPase n=1 Tax=Thermocatellispora tengchongensis TaxID=1073253 RepID=UPI0036307F76
MRPLRLHIEGFGSFREPAEIDFTDTDYFALVGPTGAGKSTVIDAICFALYGTVPRWGAQNVVHLALAPSATLGRVALVFESGGRRFGVVRVLTRNARGPSAPRSRASTSSTRAAGARWPSCSPPGRARWPRARR